MKKLLGLLLLLASPAAAQQVTPAPAPMALVCAYNGSAPTIATGNFAYVQCDSQGRFIASPTGSGVPGGANTDVQYNNSGAFGGISGWTTNGTTTLVGGTSSLLNLGNAGTTTNPTLSFTNCGSNCGFLAPAANEFQFVINAANIFDYNISAGSRVTLTPVVDFGASIQLTTNGGALIMRNSGTTFTSPANAAFQFGAADNATPVAQTLGVQSVVAGTSNTAGQNFTINMSRGTGTGAGGGLAFQYAAAGSTGSSQNALADVLDFNIGISGGWKLGAALNLGTNGVSGGTAISSNNSSGYELVGGASSATVPSVVPNRSDITTGIGANANGALDLIAGGTDIARVTTGGLALEVAATGTGSYVCGTVGGNLTLEATACPASDIAMKNPIGLLASAEASQRLDNLNASLYTYKDQQTYGAGERVGLYAQDVEKMDPRCVTHRDDGTVSTYDDRCVIAYLVADRQKMKAEIDALKSQVEHLR